MARRIAYFQVAPDALKALTSARAHLATSGVEPRLRALVELRTSQINGCAYCVDMHWKDARAGGETEQRLYGLNAWEETPYYTERERAALAWAESVTLVSETHVPDAVYDRARTHFSEKELVDLTWAVAAINAWNRMAVAMRAEAGSYQPGEHRK